MGKHLHEILGVATSPGDIIISSGLQWSSDGGGNIGSITGTRPANIYVNNDISADNNIVASGALIGVTNSLAAATDDTLQLINNTDATVGAPEQWSPSILLTGHAWDTDGGVDSQEDWRIYIEANDGNSPSSILHFAHQSEGAGYTNKLSILDGCIALPVFMVATAPSPVAGQVGYCSDGDSGSPCLSVADGSNWKVIQHGSMDGSNYWNHIAAAQPTGMATAATALWVLDGSVNQKTDLINSYALNHVTSTVNVVHSCGLTGFHFDTVNGLYVGAGATLNALLCTGALTIEILCLIYTGTTERTLISIGAHNENENGNVQYQLNCYNIGGIARWKTETGSGTDTFTSLGPMIVGEISHMIVTRDAAGTALKLYINGVLAGSATAAAAPSGDGSDAATHFEIGRNEANANNLGGIVFSVKLTKAEFSAAQVLEAYQTVRSRNISST